MEKIKTFYKDKTNLCNCLLLAIISIVGWLFFKGHYANIMTDVGREMLFSEAVLKGNVLYKDILCIYFPLAYQLNALAYLIFGTTIQTLELCGLFNITLFVLSLYLLSENFLDKKISFLISVTTLFVSVYHGTLFNMILPYSTGFTYGLTTSAFAILFAIKYTKTNKFYFLVLAYLFSGIAFTFKGEYGLILPIMIYLSFWAKPCNIKENCINIVAFSSIPALSLSILFLQGLSFNDIISAAEFMKTFFSTEAMIYHLGMTGGIFTFGKFSLYGTTIFNLLIFYGTAIFLYSKTKNTKLLWIAALICAFFLNSTKVWIHTVFIPITLFVLLVWKFKSIKTNLPLMILTLSAIAITVRMFWSLILSIYGLYTAPIAIIALIVLLIEFLPKQTKLSVEDIKKFTIFALSCYLIYFFVFDFFQRQTNNTKISTPKGTVYLPQREATCFNNAIKYIQSNTTENQKVLILQEGMALNFLTDRKVDLNMPMVDRLYYEAIGEDKIIENLKKNNYDVIFIAEGFGLTNFGKPFLYGSDNAILRYIFKNYNLEWRNNFVKRGIDNNLFCLRHK